MSKRVTRIYACGGGAIKITADLTDHVNVPGFRHQSIPSGYVGQKPHGEHEPVIYLRAPGRRRFR